MKKIILYSSTTDKSVPDFIYSKIDGVAGIYSANGKSIGISIDDAVGDFDEIQSKDDLYNFLKTIDFSESNCLDLISWSYKPRDPASAANWLWARLEYLNTLP